jgi:hypothetical protein
VTRERSRREAWEPTPELPPIDDREEGRNPREGARWPTGSGRKAKVREDTESRRLNGTLKEQESSRKDELDPKRSRDGRQERPQGRLETAEPGRKGTTQKVPDLQAYKTSRSHELHERRHGPR